MNEQRRKKISHDAIEMHPSGRPVNRAGYEAMLAGVIVVAWFAFVTAIFAVTGKSSAQTGPGGAYALFGVFFLCWAAAERVVGRRKLIWPGSALGVAGALSFGFAIAAATPELRVLSFQERLAIVSIMSAAAMAFFLFRFKLPGLVSPIITFSLLGLFLDLYGTDLNRIQQMEGFSPRGIIAALMSNPVFMAVFAVLAMAAAIYARRLDLKGGNFGLAAARPLHLIGGGVVVLIAGRMLSWLPNPLDIVTLSALWIAAHLWGLRINRVGAQIAMHFAMIKPLVFSIIGPLGLTMTIQDWSIFLTALLIFDLAIWPLGHKWSRTLNWTLGPGGRRPPIDRPGWKWRYWPYALEDAPQDPKGWT